MTNNKASVAATLPNDISASVVVFLVALPLCPGVALAPNAPLFSGVIAGIIGGIVVAALSGSHQSVSGPPGAGLGCGRAKGFLRQDLPRYLVA